MLDNDVISEGPENYLRAIYELTVEGGHETASTSDLAESLCVRAASVTGMLKKLAATKPRLIRYHPYQGASLTPDGLEAALRVVRQHRLLELYLTEALGFGWDQVHTEADRLEHHISDSLEERIADALGDPKQDPHGAPIPARDGQVTRVAEAPLRSLPEGAQARVTRVQDRDPELLRRLQKMGLVPGVELELVSFGPHGELLVRLPSGSLNWLDKAALDGILAGYPENKTNGGSQTS
ncbi:MAG: metal-dependent transcriptional regulator [Anaerolineales bacterium]|nr:metal-dependent transcriptional regulator [Anaerolineales bacterium]